MKIYFLPLVLVLGLIAGPVSAESRMAGSVPVKTKKVQEAVVTKDGKPVEMVAVKAPADQVVVIKEVQTSAPVQEAAVTTSAPAKAIKRVSGPKNYVGEIETYKAKGDDTLQTIGEAHDLGYVELRSANPTSDQWKPGAGTFMILPKMHLLPDSPRRGIVVNLSEMRLYYYPANGGETVTFPIGVGREGFSTPLGTTTVVRKTEGPTWRPTDRMRREDPRLPAVVGPGPDNPLGTHALYLGWPQYLLHGTNKPWGIGRRVSSGCVRMYNNSAEELFKMVPVGTPVAVVRQPVKFGWIGDMLYIEAHPDEALADQVERAGGAVEYKVPADIFANLSRAAGNEGRDLIDWRAVREALRDRRGYPVPILQGATDDVRFVTASMETRAGTTRFGPRLTQEPRVVPAPAPAAEQTAEPSRRVRNSRFNG